MLEQIVNIAIRIKLFCILVTVTVTGSSGHRDGGKQDVGYPVTAAGLVVTVKHRNKNN